jgi:hypothetical protein
VEYNILFTNAQDLLKTEFFHEIMYDNLLFFVHIKPFNSFDLKSKEQHRFVQYLDNQPILLITKLQFLLE